MKEKIIEKLNKQVEIILAKEEITQEETNFIFNFLCWIENKEEKERLEKEREEDKKKMSEKMKQMFEGGF